MTSTNEETIAKPAVEEPIIEGDSFAASEHLFRDSAVSNTPIELIDEAIEPDFEIGKGFRVTPEDLFQLVMYWEKIALQNHYIMWLTMMVGGAESRQLAYAYGRIKYLEKCVKPEMFKQACEMATAEFASGLDPRYWKLYEEQAQSPFYEDLAKESFLTQETEVSSRRVSLEG